MTNGRRSEARASAASYDKRPTRTTAAAVPAEGWREAANPKRERATRTTNEIVQNRLLSDLPRRVLRPEPAFADAVVNRVFT